jgi:hypothetical protein
MKRRTAVVISALTAMQLGCFPSEKSGVPAAIQVTLPVNVSIPNVDDLKQKLAQSVSQRPA